MPPRVSLKSRVGELLWTLLYRSGLLGLGRWLVRRCGGGATRILCYHRIAPDAGAEGLTPERFRRHLAHLSRRYRLLSAAELAETLARGEAPPKDGLVITVDDGYLDLAGEPLDDLAGAKATVFVLTGDLPRRGRFRGDGPELLGAEDLASLTASGVAVGSHTRRHPRLTGLEDGEIDEEIAGSRADLEGVLGEAPALVAYPWGDADGRAADSARAAGYSAGFITSGRAVQSGVDRYRIPRIHVPGRASVARVACEAAGLVGFLRGRR
jgi:peptidoglycan/xylan/chitin deacetylase (PgdA/CDA1 family)